MRRYYNSFVFYFIICVLCALNGVLYSGGGILSTVLQLLLIILSIYYAIYANKYYKLPSYLKALNVLLIMFTIYGVLELVSGGQLVKRAAFVSVSKTDYIKGIYKSLLPIYAFYVFGKKQLLTEEVLKKCFYVFFVLIVFSYYRQQQIAFLATGSEEITNNAGYSFVMVLPILVFFYKRPIVQFSFIAICSYFIVMGMKRGAILSGGLCLIWFIGNYLRNSSTKKKWSVLVLSIAMVYAGYLFIDYMINTSSYFQARLEQTQMGDSSGRDVLYNRLIEHFFNEENVFRLLFGNGADSTLRIEGDYAHNDWLEILTNQGLIGFIIYLVYWICFIISWQKTKSNPHAYMSIGMFILVFLPMSLFSMSYNCVSRPAAMVLGYCLSIFDNDGYNYKQKTVSNK